MGVTDAPAPIVSGLDGVFSGSKAQMSVARAALATARTGSTMRIACAGDSQTYGYNATSKETDGWVSLFKQMLAAYAGFSVREGICPAFATATLGGANKRSYWTVGTGWTNTVGYGVGAAGAITGAASAAGNLDFGPFTCDGFTVRYMRRSNTSTFNYWVDADSPTASGGSGADAVQTITITGLSLAAHTLHFGTIGAGAGGAIILDIQPTVSTGGVAVANLGVPSTTTASWLGVAAAFQPIPLVWQTWDPDLTFFMLGTNDYQTSNSLTSTQCATNTTTLLTAMKLAGSVIAIIQPETTIAGSSSEGWDAYARAQIAAARALSVPVIDMRRLLGGPTITAMSGTVDSGDHVHGNSEWHYQLARAVFRAVMSA